MRFKVRLSGNMITLGLMVSSILLLVLLEIFWLYRSYEKVYSEFDRDSNFIFRNVVSEIRDSIWMKNIVPYPGDSTRKILFRRMPHDSLAASISKIESTVQSLDGSTRSNVRIFITAPTDSISTDVLRPLSARIDQMRTNPSDSNRSFIISINNDTLDTRHLKAKLQKSLLSNNIWLTPAINSERFGDTKEPFHPFPPTTKTFRKKRGDHTSHFVFSNSFTTEPVDFSPGQRYRVSFTGLRLFLLKKVSPEILFSFFLTMLTSGAFVLVYGNMRKQQRLVQTKDDFINNVTHELKTPVATVSVALEALKNFNVINDPVKTKEYLEIAQRELSRLSSITDNILKTSLLEKETTAADHVVLSLRMIIEEVISSMTLLAEANNATITVIVEGDDFRMKGSREQLSSMLYNLIDNAIKYSAHNSLVEVKLTESHNTLSLVVKDNGIGIEPEYHSKIFDKFFRVPKGNVHTTKGYGLGLNYVKAVVGLHGGSIKVVSVPDQGSEFALTFIKEKEIRSL